MNRSATKTFFAACCLIACLFLFSFAVFSAETVKNIGGSTVDHNASRRLNGFSETTEGWEPMSEGVELTVSEKTNVYPYLSLTGDGCMTVRAANVKSGERVYICDKYKTPLDISGYNTVFFPINVKSVAPGKAVYKAGIELISSEGAFVSESEAYSETWSGIFADVSTWNGRPDLCEIRIYLVYETEPDKETPRLFEFCIDSLCLSESENAVFSARFLSDSLSFSGAEGVYEKDGIRVKGTGNTFTVSFDGVSPELFLSANSLKLRFVSESVNKIVLLDKDKKERYSCVTEGDDPVRTCYLALSPSFFPFSLKFECDNDPEVEIKAVVPYSMYFPEKETGKLEVCSASAGENAVTVKGSVFENAFTVYSGSVLHLFALDTSSSPSKETLTDDNKLSSLTLNSPEFSFRVPAGTEEDPKSALYKKYVAAIEYGGELIPVGDGIFVTNPEIFASNGARISKNTGRRGYTSLSPDTMLEAGGKATRVYADVGQFYLLSSQTGVKAERSYGTFYYSSEYVNRLDSEIKKYSDRNIGVTLSVYLSRTGNESVDSALVHPEAGASGRCAFGVSKEALAYLRFFCEFVSERYGLSDSEIKIQSVIFFENATSCYENCDMGKQTLKDFVEAYSLSFRVLYNAIRSNSPGVAIFTGVSRVWDADLPFDRYSRFDARAFLDCFNACVSDRGNIGWGVALDPYPSGKNDYYSSEDQTLTGRFDTDSVGVSNLEVLCDYLGRDALLFDLAKRDIAVVENTSFTGNAEKVLADHVFTFYKTASEDVGLYITDRELADTEVLKYMDTSRSLRNTYFALELLGIADWKSGIRNFSNEKIAQRTVAEGTVLSDTPEHKGSGTLFGFAEGEDEAIGYKGSETVSFESGVGDMERCLSLTPEYMGAKDRCGVILKLPSGLDMRYLQYVRLSVSAMSFPTNVQNVKLRLTLYSGADVCEAETVIKKTTKNTLIFDFSGFEKLSGVSMMSLTFESAGDKALGEPQFLISPLEVLSKEYTDIEIAGLFGEEKTEYSFLSELTPERLAAASAGIGVIAAAALTVRAVRRKKRNRAETEDRA